ncbi:MAG: hypothetical protein J6Q55_00845, partial [Clostridia bacterium]|nr:hypothetical protein [Clostridia bacterium]
MQKHRRKLALQVQKQILAIKGLVQIPVPFVVFAQCLTKVNTRQDFFLPPKKLTQYCFLSSFCDIFSKNEQKFYKKNSNFFS